MPVPFTDRAPFDRESLLQYFRDSAKPRSAWKIGMEIEKLARRASDGAPLPYQDGEPSIRGVLQFLHWERGGDPIYEGEHLIGIDGSWGTISLEPGGQVEWSSRPRATLRALREDLETHLRYLRLCAGTKHVDFLNVGVDPELPVDAMEWMPKARYKIMRPYMGARGRLAHRMMTQTASVQVAYDWSDERDWARKFRAAALLSPLATALFANSSRIEGRDSGYASYRQAIWNETDPARCGIPDVVFHENFSMEHWLDWILDVPSMFRHRSRGLVPNGGVRFRRLLERTGCEALKEEDWELHLSGVFTDVRAYRYLEIRSADLVPDSELFAVPVLWAGVLYDDTVLDRALEEATGWDAPDRWRATMDAAARDGLEGVAADGRSLRTVAERILPAAAHAVREGRALPGNEPRDLDALERIAARHGISLE